MQTRFHYNALSVSCDISAITGAKITRPVSTPVSMFSCMVGQYNGDILQSLNKKINYINEVYSNLLD